MTPGLIHPFIPKAITVAVLTSSRYGSGLELQEEYNKKWWRTGGSNVCREKCIQDQGLRGLPDFTEFMFKCE